MPSNPHDLLFKGVFSQPDQSAALLAAVLPEAARRHIRWDTLDRVPGSFVDESLSERHADLLFQAQQVSGGEALLYVLFEHQSTPDPFMPLRLHTYTARIWGQWQTEHPAARRLPPILPVVLYHGRARWNVPPSLLAMQDLSASDAEALRPLLPDLGYVLHDLSRFQDHELRGRALGRMALMLLRHAADGNLWGQLGRLAGDLNAILRESGLRAVEIVMRYVVEVESGPPDEATCKALVERAGPEALETIMSWAEKLREEGMRLGIEKGIEKGIEEGKRELLLNLLQRRFGQLSAEVTARIDSGDAADIQRWTDRLLAADSPEEVVR